LRKTSAIRGAFCIRRLKSGGSRLAARPRAAIALREPRSGDQGNIACGDAPLDHRAASSHRVRESSRDKPGPVAMDGIARGPWRTRGRRATPDTVTTRNPETPQKRARSAHRQLTGAKAVTDLPPGRRGAGPCHDGAAPDRVMTAPRRTVS